MTAALDRLRQKLENGDAAIGVVGLGYVGLPLACLVASKGYQVLGIELQAERVATINRGRCPIEGDEPGLSELLTQVVPNHLCASTDASQLAAADVISINVETPVADDHRPRYRALESACRSVGKVLKRGALVIVESTIAPGTMDRFVRPWLEEESGMKSGADFFLGHCPERVMPGKLLSNLENVSRVVGGETQEVADVMTTFYGRFVKAQLDTADMLTAELVKTGENAYRDVNIAFANEMALICQNIGGDVWRVRELLNKSPGRNMLMPGAGVGGHCIPKDPWLLVSALNESAEGSLIATARAVNDSMPGEMARLTAACLAELGVEPRQARVAVLGYSYLEDSDDARNSPSAALLPLLKAMGCDVVMHDPFIPEFSSELSRVAAGADCAVVMVAHSSYRQLQLTDLANVMRHRGLVDGRRLFTRQDAARADFCFRELGVGTVSTTLVHLH